MQKYIKDSHGSKVRSDIQEVIGNVTVINPTPPIIIGADTDSAVEGDEVGSLSAKIRGLNKTVTELNANIYYCDAVAAGAFPGANPVLVDVIDTTTGNSAETTMASSDLGSGVIPAGKTIYVLIDADPISDTTLFRTKINFYVPES